MKKYIEFYDGKEGLYRRAIDDLNEFISENENLKIKVVSYQVVRYEQLNKERTYILVEVTE
ncbi:UNVERIFIED_CONTAM: hypothetical protein KB573_03665 [Streptococcus canis]|uniref:hypothetical protein n=1 Tax=Streptococcus canis TaxID=1329 RepID=UPI002948D017|nr:hypothetical protein [Streptococcus canis]MDV5994454.1 hypothetical protein [Streptococcus canis]